jgi:hypothetical protein
MLFYPTVNNMNEREFTGKPRNRAYIADGILEILKS